MSGQKIQHSPHLIHFSRSVTGLWLRQSPVLSFLELPGSVMAHPISRFLHPMIASTFANVFTPYLCSLLIGCIHGVKVLFGNAPKAFFKWRLHRLDINNT